MSDMPRPKAYANDPAYDLLHLRPVRTEQREIRGITLDGWVVTVLNTRTVCDFGRIDRAAADPDAMLGEDSTLFHDPDSPMSVAWDSNRQRKAERDQQRVELICTALTKHGPLSLPDLVKIVGVGAFLVREILIANPDKFHHIGTYGRRWALHGQTFEESVVRKETQLMLAIRDALAARGPMSMREIVEDTGSGREGVRTSLRARDDWFAVVGIRPRQGNVRETQLWGLAEDIDGD